MSTSQLDEDKDKWTKKDFLTIVSCIIITIVFSIRKGSFDYVVMELLKQLWAYTIYSIGTVLIIIGLTKKIFKYHPTKRKIVIWSFMLAAFCAVSQFMHELFLYLTGQVK